MSAGNGSVDDVEKGSGWRAQARDREPPQVRVVGEQTSYVWHGIAESVAGCCSLGALHRVDPGKVRGEGGYRRRGGGRRKSGGDVSLDASRAFRSGQS